MCQYALVAIVVILIICCIAKMRREGLQVDETRTVDYPVNQDKSIPLESNPERTPEEVPQTGAQKVEGEMTDGQVAPQPTQMVDGQIREVDTPPNVMTADKDVKGLADENYSQFMS